MLYRREIDGLRALAVLPVVLFHAGFELFNGGFIGVDIFFVISGYLITSILIKQFETNDFKLLDFYERRARRILPALIFVVIISIPIAWFLMLPSHMKDFSQGLVAVSLFASNIFFWGRSDYFANTNDENPLLHTWSLAVEEQFYVLFPIFLIIFWRYGSKKIFWLTFSIALISFILCEWGWRNEPNANFYLSPTRAWEILSGSIAALILYKKTIKSSNFYTLLGLILIVFSIFYFDKKTPSPSSYSLIPVLGTLLIILFSDDKIFVSKVLTSKLSVGMGLISYSTYLWHQPIFAFAKLYLGNFSINLSITLIFFSILFGFLSWKFVENPFRYKKNLQFSRKTFSITCLISISFIISIGLLGTKTNGFNEQMMKYKYSESQKILINKILKSTQYDMYNNMATDKCLIWNKDTKFIKKSLLANCAKLHGKALVILGDSHAMNLFNIVSYSKSYPFVIGVSQGGCRPNNQRPFCHYENFNTFLKNFNNKIKALVYHQSGSYFIMDENKVVDSQFAFEGRFKSYNYKDIKSVENYLNDLSSKFDVNVFWVGPFLEYRKIPEKELFKKDFNFVNSESIKIFDDLDKYIFEILNDSKKINYLSFKSIFFQPKKAFYKDCFVFRDVDHYSMCGEKLIGNKLQIKFLDKYLE